MQQRWGGGWGQKDGGRCGGGGQMKERQLMWKERIKMMPRKVKCEGKNLE